MKLWLYKICGWFVIVAGLLWSLGNAYYNIIGNLRHAAYFGPGTFFMEFIVGGVLGSLGILFAFLLPGIVYLKVGSGKIKPDKLILWAARLTLFGIVLILLATLISLMAWCGPGINSYECVIPVFFLGVIPTGILYGLGLILLIISKFKR